MLLLLFLLLLKKRQDDDVAIKIGLLLLELVRVVFTSGDAVSVFVLIIIIIIG